MQRYTPRDIVVLVLIAGLFIWYYGRQPGFGGSPEGFIITLVALVVAVTFHEFAHAFIALQLGDATAKLLGRVSLNPIRHLDLFGSLAFIFFQFGWGKPVPINPYNMRGVGPLTGDFLATIAGPVSNVILAFLVTVPFRLELVPTRGLDPYVLQFIESLLRVNIPMAAFNFLPIPPLDGFSIARLFLPRNVTGWLEQYGMFVLIALVFLPQFLGRQFDFLGMVTGPLRAMITSLVFIGM
jgi:Zn-dependent protease